MSLGAVILAAGASTRLGRPKQTLRLGGESLLRRAVLAALGAECSPVVVVTGAHAAASGAELRGLDVLEAHNTDWESGMASSVRVGLEALVEVHPAAAAVVLLACDQPRVTADVVARLAAEYRREAATVVASAYGGTVGVPALFDRSLFGDLSALEGAGGAKVVIERHAAVARFVPFPDGAVDVDTPEDFARLTATPAGLDRASHRGVPADRPAR